MSTDSLRTTSEIGAALREARMRARIDIAEVERATKIRARYLRALENEEWDALPGPVYGKSFLRTYGDYLGLNSRMLVEEFKRRYERPAEHELRPVAHHRRRDRDPRLRAPRLPAWAVITLVLIGVVVALYEVGSHATKTPKTTTPASAVPHARSSSHPAQPAAPTRPPVPTAVTLQLVPTARVYVCLVDQTGRPLIPGQIFTPGQTVPTEKAGTLLLTLGNNGVRMKVNGKSMSVPASGGSIGFKLTPTGTAPLPPAKQPQCT